MQYILRRKVRTQTDDHALMFIKQCSFTNERLKRWALALQQFDLEVEYIPGKENIAADALTGYARVD